MLTDYNPKHRKVLWSTKFTMLLHNPKIPTHANFESFFQVRQKDIWDKAYKTYLTSGVMPYKAYTEKVNTSWLWVHAFPEWAKSYNKLPCKASVYFCTDDYVIIKIASHRAGENVLLATLGSCFTAFYESKHFKKLQEEFA